MRRTDRTLVLALVAALLVTVPAAAEFKAADLVYVPVVAHNEGVEDSFWMTDLVIRNVENAVVDDEGEVIDDRAIDDIAALGDEALRLKAEENPKIEFILSAVVEEILSADDELAVSGARLKSTKTGETWERECQGVFMAIGHVPNTGFLAGQIESGVAGF